MTWTCFLIWFNHLHRKGLHVPLELKWFLVSQILVSISLGNPNQILLNDRHCTFVKKGKATQVILASKIWVHSVYSYMHEQTWIVSLQVRRKEVYVARPSRQAQKDKGILRIG